MSQNHKMVEIGRHLWRTSNSTSCSKQGQLQNIVQDYDQWDFEYLQQWGLYNFWKIVPMFEQLHNNTKQTNQPTNQWQNIFFFFLSDV